MKRNGVRVERPRQAGEETEFFLQSNAGGECACHAHIHSAVELLYVERGSYTVTMDGVCYEIGEGDLILFCSGTVHHVVTGDCAQNSYYVIKMPPSFLLDLARRDVGTEYVMRFALNRRESRCLWRRGELAGGEIKRVLDTLITEYREQRYAYEVALRLKVTELLLAILRFDAPKTPFDVGQTVRLIYETMRYVQEHYAEDIDERELAKDYGMSYSYFSRSFRRVTGMPFRSYLNRTRISKSEQLLFRDGCSVSEAALACGYNSISYFIRVYRSVTGTTPYRARRAEGR